MDVGVESMSGSNEKSLNAISLFTGAMGLDLGLERAGFKIRVCVENNPSACLTIKKNRPKIPLLEDDVRNLSGDDILEAAGLSRRGAHLVCGGPPCQAFSVFGRRKGTQDERGALIFEFVRMVDEIKPRVFVMENVRGLHSMSVKPEAAKGSLYKKIQGTFEGIGYRVDCFLVNSVNYGSPQIRERMISIGNRYNLKAEFPKPTHSDRPKDKLIPFATLGEAIKDFEPATQIIMDFSERKKKYLTMVPAGRNWRSLPVEVQKESMGKSWYLKGGRSAYWRKLSYDFPCPTVVTMPNHAGTSMCHPEELRPLSAEECARVQGFPDEWEFVGSPQDKYTQIGNAVPVVLGKMVGGVARSLLHEIETTGGRNRGMPIKSQVIHIRPHVRTRWWWKDGKVTPPVPYNQKPNVYPAQPTLEDL